MGDPCGNGKIQAFPEQEQKKLLDEAIAMGACVLIEADGAKGRPCKAPADYEPVLHPDTVLVLSVYGLQAIGAAIEDSCLRVDKVEEILGKSGQDVYKRQGCNQSHGDGAGFAGEDSVIAAKRRPIDTCSVGAYPVRAGYECVCMISQDIPGYGVGFPACEAGHDSQHIPGDIDPASVALDGRAVEAVGSHGLHDDHDGRILLKAVGKISDDRTRCV